MKPDVKCSPAHLVLYTDDSLLALGASTVLSSLPQFRVLTAEPALSSLVPFIEQVCPDVILVDLTPEITLGLISALRIAAPAARLILWGRTFSEELRYQARQIGVAGFLQRGGSTEIFVQNLANLAGDNLLVTPKPDHTSEPDHSRTVSLTKRESQLVTLLAQGLKNKEIAACIGITEGTVRIYLSKLFAKIGARDRFEVAVFGLKNSFCGQASWDGRDGFVTESDEGRAKPVLRSLVLVEPQRRRGYVRRAVAVGE
jgi:DNA-binding NarL/FixJ family response regulator